MKDSGEIGVCEFWDRIEKVFQVSLESYRSKLNPGGICTCIREDFEIM